MLDSPARRLAVGRTLGRSRQLPLKVQLSAAVCLSLCQRLADQAGNAQCGHRPVRKHALKRRITVVKKMLGPVQQRRYDRGLFDYLEYFFALPGR